MSSSLEHCTHLRGMIRGTCEPQAPCLPQGLHMPCFHSRWALMHPPKVYHPITPGASHSGTRVVPGTTTTWSMPSTPCRCLTPQAPGTTTTWGVHWLCPAHAAGASHHTHRHLNPPCTCSEGACALHTWGEAGWHTHQRTARMCVYVESRHTLYMQRVDTHM